MTHRNRSRPFCRLPSWQPECQVPHSGTLALSSVWHLALWHSALFGTWHFGTQLRLALGTLALSSVCHLALWHPCPSLPVLLPPLERHRFAPVPTPLAITLLPLLRDEDGRCPHL